jgi:hypothetical protein
MDIHKQTVVVRVLPPDGQTGRDGRKSYGTFRNDLTRCAGGASSTGSKSATIVHRTTPYARQIVGLTSIPGVDRITAWCLIAELGADMSVFPDADHCAGWAGLSPGSVSPGR